MVDQGMTLHEASEILRREYLSERLTWASYGWFDLNLFKLECQRKGVPYPFSDEHINVATAFTEAFQLKRRRGMARALRKLGIEMTGTHHRGDDDAWNTAAILWRIFQEQAKSKQEPPG